jgi:hypothetical protein
MRVDHITGKRASGIDKFGSVVDRMYKKLGGKLKSRDSAPVQHPDG